MRLTEYLVDRLPEELWSAPPASGGGRGRIEGLPRRTVDTMTYLLQHDAHHRGQITRQARELGWQQTEEEVLRLWGWKKLP